MKNIYVDTSVLMNDEFNFSNYDDVKISITSIEELDNLKGSKLMGHKARRAIDKIKQAKNKEILLTYNLGDEYKQKISNLIEHKNDNQILSFACSVFYGNSDYVFLTDDYNLHIKASALGLPCKEFNSELHKERYTGYKEVVLNDYEMSEHYQNPINRYGLLNNQYLIIKNFDGEIVDKQRWTDSKGFRPLTRKEYRTILFDKVKPKDVYQEMAMDSFANNNFTIVTGKAGSGKSLCSLSYIMWLLENNKYGSCVVLYNPTKLRGAEDMGYYTGDAILKALQNSIGNILSTKFGDMGIVKTLIEQNKIILVSMADCRGMEISDNQILYITEAQNTTPDLLKIALSRCSENTKILIEGDPFQQVDKEYYAGDNNGLLRAIEVFKGEEIFGYVDLKNVWRSKIADIADKM